MFLHKYHVFDAFGVRVATVYVADQSKIYQYRTTLPSGSSVVYVGMEQANQQITESVNQTGWCDFDVLFG